MDTTATMLLYGSKPPTPEHLHSTPVKPSERGAPPHADPWTPTANLRMLISAASPDIRDREMKKVLFRPIENERAVEEVDGPCQVPFDHSPTAPQMAPWLWSTLVNCIGNRMPFRTLSLTYTELMVMAAFGQAFSIVLWVICMD